MTLDFDFILKISSLAITLFVAISLFFDSKTIKNNKYYLGFVFIFIFILQAISIKNSYNITFGIETGINKTIVTVSTVFLIIISLYSISPSIYLYINNEVKRLSFKNIWKHYILTLALILFVTIYFILETAKINFSFLSLKAIILVFIITLVIQSIYYMIKIFKEYKIHKKSLSEMYSYTEGLNLKWLIQLEIGYLLLMGGVNLIELFKFPFVSGALQDSILLLFVVFYGLKAIKYNKSIETILHFENPITETEILKIEEPEAKEKKGIVLNDEILEKINTDLKEILNKDKIYLNPDLNLKQLSKLVGVNYKYLSIAINTLHSKTFLEFINSYRVIDAEKFMMLDEYKNLPVEEIGIMVGFKSKSTFYKYFKIHYNLSPSVYRTNKN